MPTLQQVIDAIAPLFPAEDKPQTPPSSTPPAQPGLPGVDVVHLPYMTSVGTRTTSVAGGRVTAIAFTPTASSNGEACSLTQSPNGGGQFDYSARRVCLSDIPGDFTGGSLGKAGVQSALQDTHRVYFTVDGPVMVGRFIKKPDLSKPDLKSGKTYYFNIAQVDPSISARVNYSLTVA